MKSRKAWLRNIRGARIGILIIALITVALAYAIIRMGVEAPKPAHTYRDEPVVISTKLPFSGSLHFNNTVGEIGALDIIKTNIDNASRSIEIAVFSITSTMLRDALYSAAHRGVAVTIVTDTSMSDRYGQLFANKPKGVTVIQAGTHNPRISTGTTYMHNKFIIVDQGHPGESIVTGSLNFTPLGEKYNQSFMLETSDAHIIQTYGEEFDRLANGISGTEKRANSSYSPRATEITYPNGTLEIWFSPGEGPHSVKERILELVKSSERDISIMMWTLTDRDIAEALLTQARKGVTVTIIAGAKTKATAHSQITFLESIRDKEQLSTLHILTDEKLATGAKNQLPEGIVPYIHHHAMIVDGKTLVTGSGNWSLWGFTRNDENHIVTDIPSLVRSFQATFDHFRKELK